MLPAAVGRRAIYSTLIPGDEMPLIWARLPVFRGK